MNGEKPKTITQQQFLDRIPTFISELSEDDRIKILHFVGRELGASVRTSEFPSVFAPGIKDHLARVAVRAINSTVDAKGFVTFSQQQEYDRAISLLMHWAKAEED